MRGVANPQTLKNVLQGRVCFSQELFMLYVQICAFLLNEDLTNNFVLKFPQVNRQGRYFMFFIVCLEKINFAGKIFL